MQYKILEQGNFILDYKKRFIVPIIVTKVTLKTERSKIRLISINLHGKWEHIFDQKM